MLLLRVLRLWLHSLLLRRRRLLRLLQRLLRRLLRLLCRGRGLLRSRRLLGHLLLLWLWLWLWLWLRLLLLLRRCRGLLGTARATRHGDLDALGACQARAVARLEACLPRLLPCLQLLRRRLPREDGAARVGGDGGGYAAPRGR